MHDGTDRLLEHRYGGQPHAPKVAWTPAVETMLRHRSVRSFLPDPLPAGTLETMVAAAQSASTSSNLHQWSVVAVTDPATVRDLRHLSRSDAAGTSMSLVEEAPLMLVWVGDLSRTRSVVGTAETLEHLDSFMAATIDVSLAAQNAAIAAESLGLGVVFLGSMRNHAAELADLLGLPDLSFVAFGMAVGHPDPDRVTGVRPRPAQSVVLHHDRYRNPADEDWVDSLDAATRAFRAREGLRDSSWRDAAARATSLAYLDGREHLRSTIGSRGLPLR
ncbi:nitroreductase family protein [Aeromicrobium sp. Leaf350]|uniref:nitroreductase family protein n=1 Tax=Aeromicrobium sp. Leaf350 TaxID=2876565 RepID=UPI001E36643B|nr:nitroreductase family protein [Aeromicrobium sp. Leaf350]